MLFEQTKTIISFEANELSAWKIKVNNNQSEFEGKLKKTFTPESLVQVLTSLKTELKINSLRLLLDEEKTYLVLFDFPLKETLDRNTIRQKAQELIPEFLEEGYFDWKQVSQDKINVRIQILAVSKNYLLPIQQAFKKAGLTIEAYEPISFALARLTLKEKEPHFLIYYKGNQIILCAAFQGQVFEVITFTNPVLIAEKTSQLAAFLKEKWQIEIRKTISANLDPVLGLAMKNLKGKDEQVLNLNPPAVK